MKMNRAVLEARDGFRIMSNREINMVKDSMKILWTPTGSTLPTGREPIILRQKTKNCQKECVRRRWKASGRRQG